MEYVDAHTHLAGTENDKVLSYPTYSALDSLSEVNTLFWCGLHPLDVSLMNIEQLISKLTSLRKNLIGVGEIGFDFGGKDIDKKLQHDFFTKQLNFAIEQNLPVTVHCVKAYNELIVILKHYRGLRVMIHSFVGNKQMAEELISLGCYLSFSAVSLTSARTIDALKHIPIEKVLIETDAERGVMKNIIKDNYLRVKEILNNNNLEKQIYNNYLCLIS